MQRYNHIDRHRVRILPLLNKLQQFHHILAECETASVAQCMLVMQMTICVVLRMAGGEDVERNWFLDPISLIKSSNPFLLCHALASPPGQGYYLWIAPPSCHLQPNIPIHGDTEQVAKYGKVAYKVICVTK